jgi:hypothetical protein
VRADDLTEQVVAGHRTGDQLVGVRAQLGERADPRLGQLLVHRRPEPGDDRADPGEPLVTEVVGDAEQVEEDGHRVAGEQVVDQLGVVAETGDSPLRDDRHPLGVPRGGARAEEPVVDAPLPHVLRPVLGDHHLVHRRSAVEGGAERRAVAQRGRDVLVPQDQRRGHEFVVDDGVVPPERGKRLAERRRRRGPHPERTVDGSGHGRPLRRSLHRVCHPFRNVTDGWLATCQGSFLASSRTGWPRRKGGSRRRGHPVAVQRRLRTGLVSTTDTWRPRS